MYRRHVLVAAVAVALVGGPAVAGFGSSPAAEAAPAAGNLHNHATRHVCSAPRPDHVACHAIVQTDTSISAGTPNATPNATPVAGSYGPSDLQKAYGLPSSGSVGSGQTVAIIDAFDLPTAESDLSAYRTQYGLPPCTTANGCFRKVDQNGGSTLPPADPGWGQEIALDLDMVSASCPNCKILLVEANSATPDDLGTGVNTAVTLGAKYVSNSYGGAEDPLDTTYDANYFNHPGVAITVAAGDFGYGVEYPAASRYVTAVGGTSLTTSSTPRGWSETVWSGIGPSGTVIGTGSGCSAIDAKPAWQADPGCANRTVSDVAAVADPQTGVAVYDSTPASGLSGWMVFGGTSASAPLIAGVYALAGVPDANSYPSSYPYLRVAGLNDVTAGSNGTCTPSYLCTAGPGYDGPTGLGTPNGTAAFTPAGGPIAKHYADLGGSRSYLGDPAGPEFSVAGGLSQDYQYGAIYYSSATGAWAVHGAILDRYRSLGGPAGVLGFPTADEAGTADGIGRYNRFNGAGGSSIYWTSNTGAHAVQGAVYAKWAALGLEAGPLGYPTTDETGTPDGVGRYNHFTKDASIYWTHNTGAWSVVGAIQDKWAALGWESGPLGYPTTDETGTSDGVGRYNRFNGAGGSSIYWTSGTGAHAVQGAVYAKWAAQGLEAGPMGYPTTDETATPDGVGRYNHFTKDASIYWTHNTGAWSVRGAIQDKWASLGWEAGPVGYPISDEYDITGGRSNKFEHAYISWYSATNSTSVVYY